MLSLAGGVWGLPTDPRPLLAPLLACPLLSSVLRSEQIPLTATAAEQSRTLLSPSSKVKYPLGG